MADTYLRWVDSKNPGAILFLIDQSGSMVDPIANGNGRTKADVVAAGINRALYNLTVRASREGGVKPYLDIAVIGYGATVGSAWGGTLTGRDWVNLTEIASNTLRIAEVPDGQGRLAKQPFWFESVANGTTPMCAAMGSAVRMLEGWLAMQREKRSDLNILPPIVVNITDGESTDGSPESIAQKIRSLETDDGHVLVFNCHVSDSAALPVKYPDTSAELPHPLARALFDMSSPLPGTFKKQAESTAGALPDLARGMVFNADLRELGDFIDMGTRGVPAR